MTSSQIRAQARQKLTSKWGKAALVTFIFSIISYIIAFVLNLVPVLGYIVSLLITVPLSYGFIISMIKLNDDNEVTSLEFLNNGFSNFGKAWSVTLNTALKLILPILFIIVCVIILTVGSVSENTLFIVLGFILYMIAIIYAIIKTLSYKLALFILYDNPEMNGKEAVEKSAELMEGHVWSFFCLNLSFIGWIILSCFTFGIGLLWLTPYMRVSEINFYRNLIEDNNSAQ